MAHSPVQVAEFIASIVQSGGLQTTMDFGACGWASGDSTRDPLGLRPATTSSHHGFPGRDWTGTGGYLNLEDGTTDFVLPRPHGREFQGWGTYGGWLLGEHEIATGVEDFEL